MIKPCDSLWAKLLLWWYGEDHYADDCPRCLGEKKMVQQVTEVPVPLLQIALHAIPSYRTITYSKKEVVKCWRCKGRGFLISQVGM